MPEHLADLAVADAGQRGKPTSVSIGGQMTGPFLRVQETKLYGPTWVNVARIVKVQASSNGTIIVLEGTGAMQTDEPTEAIIRRLGEALAEPATPPRTPGRVSRDARAAPRKAAEPSEERHG